MSRFSSHLFVGLLLALRICFPPSVLAWGPTGHMIVASLAYDQLPKETREKWVALLKQHPDFPKWQAAKPTDEPALDFGRYLFMRASNWPDEIRKTGSPYDHPVWHYVDYPLELPACPLEPAPAGTEDILFGLDHCGKILARPAAAPVEQAAALGWIIHLVGDIQQPLHCATLVNATYPPPQGDRGGNLFFVSVAGNTINLHAFWDSLPGHSLDMRELTERAGGLATRFPRAALPELVQARTALAWSLEGRLLAIDAVYLHGKLPGSHDAGVLPPPLPPGYLASARAVADRRLALGGYRLADALQELTVIAR